MIPIGKYFPNGKRMHPYMGAEILFDPAKMHPYMGALGGRQIFAEGDKVNAPVYGCISNECH